MRRRDFLALVGGAAAAWPFVVRAQQTRLPVVGYLHPGWPNTDPETLASFRGALAETGFIEGRNVSIKFRWAEGHYDRLPELAADLVRAHVDIIAACGSSAPGLAAKAATSTIPIVFQTGADPVADRLVPSLNRPGGNVTGVSRLTVALDPKRVELLHQAVPQARVLAVLVHQGSPRAQFVIEQVQNAAGSLGLAVKIAKIGTENELKDAFATMTQHGVGAVLVGNDPAMQEWLNQIVALTTAHRLPAIANNRSYVPAGMLMSYDSSLADSFRQVGNYVGRILKGARPGQLPIQQPTKFELVINLKTAKALGLTMPQQLLASADEVIE